jgi:hypothetical protein
LGQKAGNLVIKMVEKAYVANFMFGISQRQIWFMGEESPIYEEKWKDAMKKINEIGDSSTNAEEFYNRVIKNIECFGFIRIAK